MQNDRKVPENPDVCSKVLDKVGRPSNFLMCRAMNVFDDKYRVNIYTRRYVDEIEGQSIEHSYFCKYTENGVLTIISGS